MTGNRSDRLNCYVGASGKMKCIRRIVFACRLYYNKTRKLSERPDSPSGCMAYFLYRKGQAGYDEK